MKAKMNPRAKRLAEQERLARNEKRRKAYALKQNKEFDTVMHLLNPAAASIPIEELRKKPQTTLSDVMANINNHLEQVKPVDSITKVTAADFERRDTVEDTLAARGKRYGQFKHHSRIAQNLKEAMKNGTNWHSLSADKKEALEMIQHKVARILNGDPDHQDSWHDIGGYAKLSEDLCVNHVND